LRGETAPYLVPKPLKKQLEELRRRWYSFAFPADDEMYLEVTVRWWRYITAAVSLWSDYLQLVD
jgi:hypothetical protein